MTKSFDVFLSHNSKDKPAVRELAKALHARGLKVWLDEWELIPGRPWQETLEEVIATTGSSAVLVGKDGLGPWQDAEMRGCLEEFVNRKLPVIPVLLPDAPEIPSLPFFLKRFTWVDLRGGLTEEGLDLLQWGVTGERPDRSKPPSTPTPDLKAVALAVGEAQSAPAEVRLVPPKVMAPAAVAQEQSAQKVWAHESSLVFKQALPPSICWTLAFSAVIPAFQAMVEWPPAPTVGHWFWFLVRWLVLAVVAWVIGVGAENKEGSTFGCSFLGLGIVLRSIDCDKSAGAILTR